MFWNKQYVASFPYFMWEARTGLTVRTDDTNVLRVVTVMLADGIVGAGQDSWLIATAANIVQQDTTLPCPKCIHGRNPCCASKCKTDIKQFQNHL